MCKEQPVDTEEYRGFTIEIFPDECPSDPTQEWDMLGKMVCAHRRYDLGHVQVKDETEAFEEILTSDQITDALVGNSKDSWLHYGELSCEDIDRLQAAVDRYAISLPLYLYDHSGITMSTGAFSCPWDSGMVGVVYVTKEAVREEYKWKRITKGRQEKIEKYLRQEVETYDNYLTGSVYGFIAKDVEGHETDSCWGFYGYDHEVSGLMHTAREEIDGEIESRERREAEWKEREREAGESWVDMLAVMAEEF